MKKKRKKFKTIDAAILSEIVGAKSPKGLAKITHREIPKLLTR